MTTTMFALTTFQGTAAAETALCADCFQRLSNQALSRRAAASVVPIDVRADTPFVDCSDNEMLACVVCGTVAPDA